ncbi:unnamed protein product [Ambrosiozyma monospora]|uniref:Unnamed protein product n=1 Tax=Ambrosiozyma monospora TaxID=43982 RepID=A0ACB5SYW5_AMBMO|nr:unnamed protein product [Ambrosiozyma monospora]
MTSTAASASTSKTADPANLDYYLGFDHMKFYVGSSNVCASHFVKTYGFKYHCFKGLETGERFVYSVVISNGDVFLEFVSALVPPTSQESGAVCQEIHDHIMKHGDAVKDVAFKVNNVEKIYRNALVHGATPIQDPITFTDEYGSITTAKIGAFGDTVHTLVDRTKYKGYLPGTYRMIEKELTEAEKLYPVELKSIDHCVQNHDWFKMVPVSDFYRNVFGFHKYWSVDEKQVYTEYSALRSNVMADPTETIKMPINEPAKGLKKSQIEEFLDFYGGPGVQHIAIQVEDILTTIANLRKRGAEFIKVPDTYYANLEKRMVENKHPEIKEPLEKIKKLGILVDFDENGYLLQLFTKPLFDRPTIFFEFIQRNNHNGFGAGNFKGLFEVLEGDQALRGNLVDQSAVPENKAV